MVRISRLGAYNLNSGDIVPLALRFKKIVLVQSNPMILSQVNQNGGWAPSTSLQVSDQGHSIMTMCAQVHGTLLYYGIQV